MVRRSGQMGVPVITIDDSVVVGFDQARLERLVPLVGQTGQRLGAAVAQRSGHLLVGTVHPGTPAARAGLKPGDLILAVDGVAVGTSDQLQARSADSWRVGRPVRMRVRRDAQEIELSLPPAGPAN